MKTYISEKQIRMVGQVWEIRRFLKTAQRMCTQDTSLLAYLAGQTDNEELPALIVEHAALDIFGRTN